MRTTMYQIGEKIWKAGDEITITSEPYELYGGMWQNGVDENGKSVTIATPEHVAAHVKTEQEAWKRQQEGFRRVRENKK